MRAKPGETRESSAKNSKSRKWVGIGLILGLVVCFAAPPLLRYAKAPPISGGFGIEDAVVALRLDARNVSYLVLVNDAGETRSVRLAERGFESSRIAWSAAGLSTGGPTHEYLLHDDRLTEFSLSRTSESLSERARLETDQGFAAWMGSAEGQQLAFVDAAAGSMTVIDGGYSDPELASCDGELVMVHDDGVEAVTEETRDLDGLGMFDGVEALVCDADRVYGLGEISDGSPSRQTLRIWNRETGETGRVRVQYPESVQWSTPSSLFVREGRLYWAVGGQLWSARPPAAIEQPAPEGGEPVVEAEPEAELFGRVGAEYLAVVGTDEGVLAEAGGRVYGVAADEDLVTPRKFRSYDRLRGFAIFSVDTTTGESRIEIDVDDIDFPKRDLHVHAIAVNPEWAAAR